MYEGVRLTSAYSVVLSYQRRYVHRRGRTARAGAEGLSLALVGEQDSVLMRRILREMGYDQSRNLPAFPIDRKYADPALVCQTSTVQER